jgi:hypothetical protein
LFQLIALPVAMRVLGREDFGVYATVSIALSIVILLEIGVGPALAHGISSAKAQESEDRVGSLTSSAFFLVLGMALLVGVVLSGMLLVTPLPWLFGDGFAGKEAVLRPALWTGLALLVMLFVLNLTDRIREGLLQVSANNTWGALGNVIAAVVVAAGIGFVPQVWFLVLAVYGSLVIAKVCNTVALWRAHPEVRPAWTRFRPTVARHLLTDGVAFSACTLVTGIVEFNLCGLLVGRQDGPAATALYQVFISITVMQLGVVMMLSISAEALPLRFGVRRLRFHRPGAAGAVGIFSLAGQGFFGRPAVDVRLLRALFHRACLASPEPRVDVRHGPGREAGAGSVDRVRGGRRGRRRRSEVGRDRPDAGGDGGDHSGRHRHRPASDRRARTGRGPVTAWTPCGAVPFGVIVANRADRV